MSDINLLAIGCVVSFIAAAGAYVYIRECYTAEEMAVKAKVRDADVQSPKLRGAA